MQKCVKRKKNTKDTHYAIYKGDVFIDEGKIKELSERQGIKPASIRFMTYHSYLKRIDKMDYDNCLRVIVVEDD